MATISPEAREAVRLLRGHSAVKRVKLSWYEIAVQFTSGITENWILHPRPNRVKWFSMPFPDSNWWGRDIPTFNEFQTILFNDKHNKIIEPHFKIQHRDFARSGFMNTRIKIHELTKKLYDEGWIELKYPTIALQEDLYKISIANFNTVSIGSNYVRSIPYNFNRQPGVVILSHFINNWGSIIDEPRHSLEHAWGKKAVLYRVICKIHGLKRDITRTELMRELMVFCSKKYGPRFTSPVFYRGLLEKTFNIKNPIVLDPTPHIGSVALAVNVCNGKMFYEPVEPFASIAYDLSKFLDIPIEKYNGEDVDIVLFGTRHRMSLQEILTAITKYHSKAKHIVCCVDKSDQAKIVRVTNPKRIIKATLGPILTDEDCILVY